MTVDRYTHLWELVIQPYIILVLQPFNRVITVSSPARVHKLCKQFLHPDKGSRTGFQPMEGGPNSHMKVVGYSHDVHATIVRNWACLARPTIAVEFTDG